MPGRSVGLGRDVKSSGVEASEILITRFSNRAKDLEVVDGLEEVRFAVTVVPDEDGAIGRQLQIDALQIPEVANRDSREPGRA